MAKSKNRYKSCKNEIQTRSKTNKATKNPSPNKRMIKRLDIPENSVILSNERMTRSATYRKQMSILDLPILSIYNIFSYVDARTLLTKVQLVCRYFKNIVRNDSLWKSFRSLSFYENEDILYIVRIIKKCPNLRHLKVIWKLGRNFDYNKKILTCSLFDVLSHYPQLRSLSLSNFRIGLDCEDSFRGFMKSLPNLSYMDLDKCYISNKLAEMLSEGRALKSLCLSRCYSIENRTFIKIFKRCSSLEHLNLSQQDTLNDKVFNALFTLCSNNIKTLLLRDISIQHANFAHIKNCSKLSTLSIDCHFLNDKTLSQIKQLPCITHLELSYGLLFTAYGLRKFFEDGAFSKLKNLNLTCCAGLEDSSLEVLADKCQELQFLDLAECWRVTDKGIYYVMQKCTKLVLLNLEDLKELKGLFLSEMHEHLKLLVLLNLSFCDGITTKYLKEFMELNPNFEIRKCKEYRLKPTIDPCSRPLILISQGMMS